MIFERNDLIFKIIDVYRISRKNTTISTQNKSCHVISYRLSGEALFKTKNSTFKIHKGNLLYIPKDMSCSQETQGEEIIAIHLDILNNVEKDISIFTCADTDKTNHIFTEIAALWAARELGFSYKCLSLLYEMFGLIEKQSAPETVSFEQERIQKSIDYINTNYNDENINIKSISQISNVSEVYFRKLFKKLYFNTPTKYINELRIAKSIPLLKSEYYSIAEIAEMVGFSDPNYFCSVFKTIVGKAPSAYKKVHNSEVICIETSHQKSNP